MNGEKYREGEENIKKVVGISPPVLNTTRR
jgi:hypothetical protein